MKSRSINSASIRPSLNDKAVIMMMQSIGDYENWRDAQHDRPMPDDGPDERSVRFYSQDYPADTVLEYTRTGDRSELRLSFSSEDPDMGTEEMVYGADGGESMQELVSELKAELTGYLDAADTSSFYEQQSLSRPEGLQSQEEYFGEYSRTSLYAFEAILQQTEHEAVQNMVWKPLEAEKLDWLYSGNHEEDLERGCIGHLRGDFGNSGKEFWTGWFDHQPNLKNKAFQDELQDVVNGLRREGGLLKDFASMSRQCRNGLPNDASYGFRGESRNYTYCLRCIPQRGNYNFYLYAYDKNAQREHAREKAAQKVHNQIPEKPRIMKNEMER